MIVLGLDGATHSLLRPWVDAGHLPTFARLYEESVHGDLESTIPEITVPAWPAFATGRNPERLDVYGFTHFNRETRELDLSHDEFIPGKMWDVVDDQGGRCVVFNIPGSYPWQAIDGTIVAAAPEYKESYSHPEDRWDELESVVGEYKLRNDATPGSRRYVDQSLSLVDKRFDGFEHFIRKEDPELAVGLIRATDRVAHHYWSTDPDESNALFEVYRRVDERLGEFLDAHDDEDVVVMSDHGFEAVSKKFAPNYVLSQAGLVGLRESGDGKKQALGKLRDAASDVLGRVGLLTLARNVVPESYVADLPTGSALGLDNAISLGRVDWGRTRAVADVGQKTTMVYALPDDADERAEIIAHAREKLAEAADDVGLDVRFVELDRGGPHTPDLAMVIETPEVHASSRFDAESPLFDVSTSGHARHGIFFARGPSFRTGTVEGAAITDIAPTVLHALGRTLPSSTDGEVLDVFAPDTDAAERDPEYYDFVGGGAVNEGGVSGDDERETEVKSRLRELGYLE
ncbi:alkaline phosphatase family protein [Haloprofundus salinisoli]|uniref:alkaline phosphatase family protein n=1 Tax=Haloprofundus salinisoli TaxID=2876193 RepID=UPI001CCCFFDC|nr:alkaline phosphatase family protein [Haloprofundus salinisoli]